MSSKVWKEYVHMYLEAFEGEQKPAHEKSEPARDTEAMGDILKQETRSWCPTLDRCMAYTFESYCKLVFTRALQYANTSNTSVLTENHIRQASSRLFNPSREQNVERHDTETCATAYRNYLSWYNRFGYRIYERPFFSRRNLSCGRARVPYQGRRNSMGKTKLDRITVDLGKYESVAPNHRAVDVSLNMVFEQ